MASRLVLRDMKETRNFWFGDLYIVKKMQCSKLGT